jgi:dihydrofolate synthase/folylpolyglutamate synthase
VCCTAPSPRGLPAADIARAARELGCDEVREFGRVDDAIDHALSHLSADDAVLVTGSLYVVGAARAHLRRR